MLSFLKSGQLKQGNGGALEYIPIDAIVPNPFQPRKIFSEDSIEELAKSMSEFGILQPVSVRRKGKNLFELIAGERRWRAALVAGLTLIPAIVLDTVDEDSALIALIENIQREDLHFFEEAEAIYNLIDEHGFTQEELAKVLGRSQPTIANKLRLLRLPNQIKARILQGRLTERHARALLRLSTEHEQNLIVERIIAKSLTVKEAEEFIDTITKEAELPVSVNNHRKQFKLLLRDYKPFFNTIRKTIDDMKSAGVEARYTERETDEGYEIVLILPSRREG